MGKMKRLWSRVKDAAFLLKAKLSPIGYFPFEHPAYSSWYVFGAGIVASIGAELFLSPFLIEKLPVSKFALFLSGVLFFMASGALFRISSNLEGFKEDLIIQGKPPGKTTKREVLKNLKEERRFNRLHRLRVLLIMALLFCGSAIAILCISMVKDWV